MKPDYKYEFEKAPSKKGTCPGCGHKGEYRYYVGLSREYGKCERVNSCGYQKKPDEFAIPTTKVTIKRPEPKILFPDDELCKLTIANQSSNFHVFCIAEKLNISKEHLTKWNVGSRLNERTNSIETAYVYQNTHQKYVNIRYFQYSNDGKRSKSHPPLFIKSCGDQH